MMKMKSVSHFSPSELFFEQFESRFFFSFFSAGHGNHKESSPFLNNSEAGKGGDYYDRNLALFEVNKGSTMVYVCAVKRTALID